MLHHSPAARFRGSGVGPAVGDGIATARLNRDDGTNPPILLPDTAMPAQLQMRYRAVPH